MSSLQPKSSIDPRKYVKTNANGSKKASIPNKKKKDWHWSLTLTLVGWFVSFIAILLMRNINIIYFSDIIVLILVSGLFWSVVQFIPFKNLQNKKGGDKLYIGVPLYLVYNFAGLGMISTAFILFGNFAFSSGEKGEKIYKIVDYDHNYHVSTYTGIVYLLEDNALADDEDLRWFEVTSNGLRNKNPYVLYQFEKGAFGFLVRGKRFLVEDTKGTNPIEQDYIN
jgi:hypothetical protein